MKGGRKRAARAILESRCDSSQRRGIYPEFHLFVSERAAGEIGFERDPESGSRQTLVAGAAGECGAIRVAVWDASGGLGASSAIQISDSCSSPGDLMRRAISATTHLPSGSRNSSPTAKPVLERVGSKRRGRRLGTSPSWSRSLAGHPGFHRRVLRTRAPRGLTFSVKVVSVPGKAGCPVI